MTKVIFNAFRMESAVVIKPFSFRASNSKCALTQCSSQFDSKRFIFETTMWFLKLKTHHCLLRFWTEHSQIARQKQTLTFCQPPVRRCRPQPQETREVQIGRETSRNYSKWSCGRTCCVNSLFCNLPKWEQTERCRLNIYSVVSLLQHTQLYLPRIF